MSKGEDRLPTRTSLLRQVQNEAAHTQWEAGWEEFYAIYRPLIFGVARQAGLNSEEAEDVVLEVMAELRRRIGSFEPRRERGPFKAWLLNLVRWRIRDKLRKCPNSAALEEYAASAEAAPSPCSDEAWDAAWRQRLLDEALDRVRTQADERSFQIFRVCTTQKIAAQQVAKSFGVNVGQVWLAKHRVTKLIRKEVQRLENAMERGEEGA